MWNEKFCRTVSELGKLSSKDVFWINGISLAVQVSRKKRCKWHYKLITSLQGRQWQKWRELVPDEYM